MRLLSFAHNEWTVLVAVELCVHGPDEVQVVPAAGAARRLWDRVAADRGVSGGPGGTAPADVDVILLDREASLPDTLAAATPATRVVMSVRCPDPVAVDDPLRWAVLNGYDSVDVAIHVAGDAGLRAVDSVRVSVAGLDYHAAAGAVGAALWKLVQNADLTAATRPMFATPTGPVLPLDRHTTAIDWSATAEDVARRVRAGAAWTYLDGFQISIGEADPIGGGHNVAPGTIVRRDDDRVIVQTGRGQIRVAEVKDVIGKLDPQLLRPGLRFGVDVAEECRLLRRRVADLEQAVQLLVDRWRLEPAAE